MYKILILVTLLSGCVPQRLMNELDWRFKQFKGRPESALVQSMGQPQNVYKTDDGVKFLTYARTSSSSTVIGPSILHNSDVLCYACFTIADAKVTEVKWSGSYERCRLMAPDRIPKK